MQLYHLYAPECIEFADLLEVFAEQDYLDSKYKEALDMCSSSLELAKELMAENNPMFMRRLLRLMMIRLMLGQHKEVADQLDLCNDFFEECESKEDR